MAERDTIPSLDVAARADLDTEPRLRLVAPVRPSQTEPACALARGLVDALEPLKAQAADAVEAALIDAMQIEVTRCIGDLRERQRMVDRARRERR